MEEKDTRNNGTAAAQATDFNINADENAAGTTHLNDPVEEDETIAQYCIEKLNLFSLLTKNFLENSELKSLEIDENKRKLIAEIVKLLCNLSMDEKRQIEFKKRFYLKK